MNSSPSGRAGTQEVWSSGAKLGIEAGPDAAPVMASEVAIRPAIVQTLRKQNMRFLPRSGCLAKRRVGGRFRGRCGQDLFAFVGPRVVAPPFAVRPRPL